MKSSRRWLPAGLGAVAVVAGAGILLQREVASALGAELERLRDESQEYARARARHERLKASQVPDAELQRLRADHAALVRLRSEIDALKARADQMAQQEADAASAPPAPFRPPPPPPLPPPPALALSLGFSADGSLSLDNAPIDIGIIKQRFAALARGDRVEIRLRVPDSSVAQRFQNMKQSVDQIAGLAKEFGLKMSLQTQAFETKGAASSGRD